MARQKLGQHFLQSEAWRERIAEFLPRDADSFWIEIGAGHGEMTSLLAQRARRVIAIETDPALAASLRERFASNSNVEIVEADVLTFDFAALIQSDRVLVGGNAKPLPIGYSELACRRQAGEESAVWTKQKTEADSSSRSLLGMTNKGRATNQRQGAVLAVPKDAPVSGPSGPEARPEKGGSHTSATRQNLPFRVYGNLPYYITSPILSHLFQFIARDESGKVGTRNTENGSIQDDGIHIDSIHAVVQLEVAERITASPRRRDYGYLSALCQYFTEPELALKIPAGAFAPPPKVSSALVAMRVPGARANLEMNSAIESQFLKFLQLAFAHKRKTLRNNLRAAYSQLAIENALGECRLGANARAEEIALPQFAALFGSLRQSGS